MGNGVAIFKRKPRLYIAKESGVEGWADVEMTAYCKYVSVGDSYSYSGCTMVARSNHDTSPDGPCGAFGYYARLYQGSGECAFQKEYWHGDGTVYSPSRRVDCFSDGLPLNQWIGMKFKVTTLPGTSDVKLELWLDENDNGNWVLRHSFTDRPGEWTSSKSVPNECEQNNGDTVLRPGNVCFLRSDGADYDTEVHWRDATITNSLVSVMLHEMILFSCIQSCMKDDQTII